MKKRILIPLMLLFLFSILLSSCAPRGRGIIGDTSTGNRHSGIRGKSQRGLSHLTRPKKPVGKRKKVPLAVKKRQMRQYKVEFLRNSPNIYGLFLSPLLGLDVPSYASRPKIDDSRLNLTSHFGGVSNFAFETPPEF